MKELKWYLTALFVLCFVASAYAQSQFPPTPKSRPNAAPQVTQAEVQAPAPAQVQAPSPVINVAPPSVSVSPQLVAPPTSTMDEVKSWLNTIFGGMIAALLAKIGFKPAAPPAVVAGAEAEPANILLALRDKATDPVKRARIDETLLTVLGTGIPSQLVQTGLSAVPVAGPILSGAEPLLHDFFVNALKDRLAGNKP